METRAAAKRRATAPTAIEIQQLKKQRVVLGELPNSPNLIAPPTLSHQKPQLPNNPKLNTESRIDSKPGNRAAVPNLSEPYASDICSYLRSMEAEKKRRPMTNYLEKVQRGITSNMRGTLVDWLVEVAEEYNLLPETLFLSISYIDRLLSTNQITKPRLQLLGVSSMLIASKYEEISPPRVLDFCDITDNTYTKSQVVQMEADVLKALKFEMGNPTVKTFLRPELYTANSSNQTVISQIEFLSNYLAELSLLDYDCLRFLPSMVAASAVFLARFIICPVVNPWTSSLRECTGYKSAELKECVLILHDLYLSRRAASLKAVREKYKHHKFKCVANLPSPPRIPNSYFKEQ